MFDFLAECGSAAVWDLSSGGHVTFHFLRGIRNRARGIFCSEQAPAKESWNLVPLTPEYLAEEHGGYVAAIEAALAKDQVRNIALSGNYGVGKSSIMQEVARRQDNRIVELSLSTLAPIEASQLDNSVPIQATTPTNRIQQEIVKQLLYREYPSRTPGSRFRRIERFRWWRVIGTSMLLGFVVAVIFLLTGWTLKIDAVFTPYVVIGVWAHLVIWSTAALTILLVSWLFYGKLHIKQLSAGAATVTLNESSVSYFDQYLDEIVYFFEVSDRDIVLFEDVDRFNDSHIFETLRALNTLLNASPQIKKPIRFIYAIKDSIFDRIGLEIEGRSRHTELVTTDDPAQVEAIRANRTKFFDLVIPVVPFITHRSARNLALQLLSQVEHQVSPELLDLAAQFVPDMRLLKNVRNEFIVFRDRIFSGDGKQLNLSETDLFAMMLYKSTHLADFETIRLGHSKLDILYKLSRELVTENIRQVEGEIRALRQQISRINGAASRSAQLGERLLAHVQRTAESAGFRTQNAMYLFAGAEKSSGDLQGTQFWTSFVSPDRDLPLEYYDSYRGHKLSFTRDSLAAALGDPLDAESWNETDREEFTEQIEEKMHEVKFLGSADLGDLIKRPKFLVQYEDNRLSLEAIAKFILTPGLAYQIVRAGYINRNFTLYTSTFHGDRVGSAATNFIIHHVERDLTDLHFQLTPEDVDAVVRERGKSALKEPALYNIAILDHLLAKNIEEADIMIRSLVGLGAPQANFLQAYLTAGNECTRLIERFTVASTQVLTYLVSQADLDDSSRLELLNVALAHVTPSKQRIDSAVSSYLWAHYAEFAALKSDATVPAQAERISVLFEDAGITVPRLELLGHHIRTSFVSRNLYEITYLNLAIAIDNSTTVALDVIRDRSETVYDYVFKHLKKYLEAIDGTSTTIDANEKFLAIIEDVLSMEATCLGDVIKLAALDCEVVDLSKVSEGAWPALAQHRRFPATFSNISRYVAVIGIDAQLAGILTAAAEITDTKTADEESKTALAIAILAARDQLPSAVLRTKLVASLSLRCSLTVGDIAAEVGDLFAQLLKHDIIADEAASYEHLASTDWLTRRGFIRESGEFSIYMTPALVGADLAELLKSDEIDTTIKNLVVEQATKYAEVADQQGLNELARFAIRCGFELSPDVVQKMAQENVSMAQILLLLQPHLGVISRDQLFIILQALDGDYPKLTEVGRSRLRVPDTLADRELLDRLRRERTVSSYDFNKGVIEVNRKRK